MRRRLLLPSHLAKRVGKATEAIVRSENDFLSLVKQWSEENNWLFYHTVDSRRSERGFPDCAIARDGVVLLWELKRTGGHLRMEQKKWLKACGEVFIGSASVYYPEDSASIIRQLENVESVRLKLIRQLFALECRRLLHIDTEKIAKKYGVTKELVDEIVEEICNEGGNYHGVS